MILSTAYLGFDPNGDSYPLVCGSVDPSVFHAVTLGQGLCLVIAFTLFPKRRLSVVLVRLLGLEKLLQASGIEERVFLVVRSAGLKRVNVETETVVALTRGRFSSHGLGSTTASRQFFQLRGWNDMMLAKTIETWFDHGRPTLFSRASRAS